MYDVTALGELLMILLRMGIVNRKTLYLRQIPEGHRAMCLQCLEKWAIGQRLLEKSDWMLLEKCYVRHFAVCI